MDNAQSVYNRLIELKEQSKKIHEEMDIILHGFSHEYQDKEFQIVDKDGKEKWFRVYQSEGRFVYNQLYEFGVRANPKNPAQ